MLPRTTILVYSHGIAVKPADRRCKEALADYCRGLAQWEYVKKPPSWKPQKVMTRIYAGATSDRSEFRFHRHQLDDVMRHMAGYGIHVNNIAIEHIPPAVGYPVDLTVVNGMEPLENQVDLVGYLANPDQTIKVTELQTGKGKTASSLFAASKLGVRFVIQLRGGYVDRWLDDLVGSAERKGFFDLKKGELLVVRGSVALLSLINTAKAGDLKAKVIIITSKTMYAFIKEFEKNPRDNYYGCRPEELYSLIQAGLRIVDEVHEDYHLNYRCDIYCNIQSSIHLSATLTTDDVFRRQMYDIALPKHCWHKGVAYDKYIGVNALFFTTKKADLLRCTERGQDTYSHGAYEASIMKNKEMLENYLRLIQTVVQKDYIEYNWASGQKCIIFCRLVEFCEIVRNYLRKFYGDLSVEMYVSDTEAIVLKTADIIVSTIESCGTAQDIPGLKMALLTRALSKRESNEQVKGRLRKLKRWPDITPIFNYFVNTSVDAHVRYHEQKLEQFHGRVLYHRSQHMGIAI